MWWPHKHRSRHPQQDKHASLRKQQGMWRTLGSCKEGAARTTKCLCRFIWTEPVLFCTRLSSDKTLHIVMITEPSYMFISSGPRIGERRRRKLCDKEFSHPLYFLGQQPSPLPSECLKEDVMCSERLCTFSTAALSLQKRSPRTVCLHTAQHWLHDKQAGV